MHNDSMILTTSEVDVLSDRLSKRLGYTIGQIDILQVFNQYREEIDKVLNGSSEKMRLYVVEDFLSGIDFRDLWWEIEHEEVNDTLPQMPGDLLGFIVKSVGKRWMIHKYDEDPFPSDPHAHCEEDSLKLDLTNGDCHSAKHKRIVRRLRRKDLLEIRSKFNMKGVTLPNLAV